VWSLVVLFLSCRVLCEFVLVVCLCVSCFSSYVYSPPPPHNCNDKMDIDIQVCVVYYIAVANMERKILWSDSATGEVVLQKNIEMYVCM